MKKRWCSGTFLILITCLSEAAVAAEQSEKGHWYISAKYGTAMVEKAYSEESFQNTSWQFDDGDHLALAVGSEYGPFRFEAEYSIRVLEVLYSTCKGSSCSTSKSALDGDQDQQSGLINLYWSPDITAPFQPYLVGGLGITRIEWKNIGGSMEAKDTVFTYKLGTGLRVDLTPKMGMSFNYSYLKPANVTVFDNSDTPYSMTDQQLHVFDIGVEYRFW